MTEIRKVSMRLPISVEDLNEALAIASAELLRPRTQEELAEAQTYRQQRAAEAAQRRQANLDRLALIDDALACKVLDLHSPTSEQDYGEYGCAGCPVDTEDGAEPWPCATARLVAEHYDIELQEAM